MQKYGFDLPSQPRKTFLHELEESWYLPLLAKRKGIPLTAIKRSNFGQYDMAVNYLSSVLDEASANNVRHTTSITWPRSAFGAKTVPPY